MDHTAKISLVRQFLAQEPSAREFSISSPISTPSVVMLQIDGSWVSFTLNRSEMGSLLGDFQADNIVGLLKG